MLRSFKRRSLSTIVVFLLIVTMTPLYPIIGISNCNAAFASEDNVAPVLNGFRLSSQSIERPGTLSIQLDITEEGAGFSDFSISLEWKKGSSKQSGSISTGLEYGGASGDMCSNFSIFIDSDSKQFGEYSGIYTINLHIGEGANVSEYSISSIWIRDKEGNESRYDADSLNSLSSSGARTFRVTGNSSDDDNVAPVLNGFRLSSQSIERPGTLSIQLDITEEGAGFSDFSISLEWKKGSSKQSGSISTGLEYGGASGDMCSNFRIELNPKSRQFGESSGVFTFDLKIAEKAIVSSYSITEIWIRDKAGNTNRYSINALKQLSTSGSNTFSVTGNTDSEDFVAPVLNSYEILTPVVNRPGIMQIKLNLVEEKSGFSDISLSLSWQKNGKKQNGSISTGLEYGGASGDMCSNFRIELDPKSKQFGEGSGSYIINLVIGPRADVSVYSVDRIWLRDGYGNTTSVGQEYYGSEYVSPLLSLASDGDNTFILEDEFDYAFTTGCNNPSLANQLKSMVAGKTAKVEIVGDKVLKKECIDAIRGTDKTIVAYSNGIQWIIRGKDIINESKDLCLDVKYSLIPTGEYSDNPYRSGYFPTQPDMPLNSDGASYTVKEDFVKLEFYPNGNLPCPVEVRFKSDYLYDEGLTGRIPGLYYYDGEKMVLENTDCDLDFDGTDKWCYIHLTHNSTFAVAMTNKAVSVKKKSCRIVFKDGLSVVKSISILEGQPLGNLPVVSKKNFVFKGWYTKGAGGTKATSTTIAKSDRIYIAQWEAESKSSSEAKQVVKFSAKAAQTLKVSKKSWKNKKLKKSVSKTIKLTKNKDTKVKKAYLTKKYKKYSKQIKLSKGKNRIKVTLKKGYPKKLKSFKFCVELKSGKKKTFTCKVR